MHLLEAKYPSPRVLRELAAGLLCVSRDDGDSKIYPTKWDDQIDL